MPTKVHLVKAMVFSVVMYGCVSCTIKKVRCQKIDVLNYGVGEERTARRFNQSILKEIRIFNEPEYSLEELMLKLKLQYFGQLI